jgi:hypothetical protein
MSNKVPESFKQAGYENPLALAVRVRPPGLMPLSRQEELNA